MMSLSDVGLVGLVVACHSEHHFNFACFFRFSVFLSLSFTLLSMFMI